ncbi:MAG: hypothetical protein MRJ96_12290 [Nitrospirales bacterium]|nr:hypothetical protein [Nitrospira sp.]MDR4502221.1 hypothetical protein [Nitrospirales bacterium]
MPSFSKSVSAKPWFGWLVFLILLGMILLGWIFLQLTETYLGELKGLSPDVPQPSFDTSAYLLILISMAAGFPAVGIGTYFLYRGHRMRVTQQRSVSKNLAIEHAPVIGSTRAITRGLVLMISGGLIIISGLAMPLIVWRLAETF